jgi:hypothetical protein
LRPPTAKKRIGDIEFGALFIAPGDANIAYPEIALGCTGLVDKQDAPARCCFGGRHHRQRSFDHSPVAKRLTQQVVHVSRDEIAGDRDDEPVRPDVIIVVSTNIVCRDSRKRIFVAVDRRSIRVIAEQERVTVNFCQLSRVVVLGCTQQIYAPVAQFAHFGTVQVRRL